ncbi:hypothetical protein BBI17_001237 [Phytophthora kernoviae]|uniref:Peptidase C1A papain C-terminal domain-containing protein n=1 Tax=Phytophthora kernoviae TaxID=325452 RepID=A0A3R7INN3_9STRA|nr:hypothetical protein JM18_001298 [Phytophthora kernoviae]RLN43864.1 hypothetical protein BBI17_001237 [Phytophthora kernoviae]
MPPPEEIELYNPDAAAMLGDSACSMSPLDIQPSYQKLRYVYDDYIEGGALRSGGAPKLFSKDYIGLVAQYAAVGFIDGVLPNVIYPFLQNYLNLPGSQTTTAAVLVQLPWSFKVFYGILSDCFPIRGYRRRPYMLLGWIVALAMLLVMVLTPEGDPYFTDPQYRDMKPEDYTPEIVATINYDATNDGSLYIIPMMGCAFGYLMSDVCADGIVVELAQREPLEIRGRTQTVIYTTRFVFNILSLILVAFCFNGDVYGGDFDFSLSFPVLMLVVAIILAPIVPLTWLFIYEEKRPHDCMSFKHYMCELWDIVQTRAVYQYIAYQFFSGIFAMFTYVSKNPIQVHWANVTPLDEKIGGLCSTAMFAIAVWFAGNQGRDWDWRRTAAITMISSVTLDATCKLLTIWDIVRSPWFWLGIPVLGQIPQGIIFIVGSFIIVELSTEGHEGAMYGLLTTVYNLATPFSTAIARNINGIYDLSTERIQNDTYGVRYDVTKTVIVMYAFNLFSLIFLVMLPRQKEQTQVMKRLGGSGVVNEARVEATNAHEPFSTVAATHFVSKNGLLPMALLPSKFAVDYVTPRQDQAYRGTCWDFATIGFLEQSYRAHGVKEGWLAPDEYVAFSEQAYGAEILKLCSGDADSLQQKDCRVAGDEMWMNSTEGGESMTTKYEDMSVREHLVRRNQAMPLSTPIAMVTHYYPCIGKFANNRHCQSETCTLCPGDMATTTCCIPLKGGRNRNMEGEFFSHRGMSIEGGHAMLLVGYNDAFLTREGFTGGLIVKNSWADGPYQGSHSLAYWMQEVSDWEERSVCPNSYNPFNWYQCGNEGVSSKQQGNESQQYNEGVNDCLSEETKLFADINIQPLQLKCKDPELCRTDGDFTYFVRNTTDWGDHMTVMCLWEYSAEQHVAREICLQPMLELYIALTLAPVAEEVKENDTDRCGFYFIPYVGLRQWIAQFQGFFVNSFDIKWDSQSYAANKALHPELDYSLLEASTKTQNYSDFLGPFPYAKVVKHFQ